MGSVGIRMLTQHMPTTVCALIFAGCIFRGFVFQRFSRFNICGRPCFTIAQEHDLNFRRSKLSWMASNP